MQSHAPGLLQNQSPSMIPNRSSSLHHSAPTRPPNAIVSQVGPSSVAEMPLLPHQIGTFSASSDVPSAANAHTTNIVAADSHISRKTRQPARSVGKQSNSTRTDSRSTDSSTVSRKVLCPTNVQRWAGLTRTVSDWDLIRRDPELWDEEGDCCVHLHAQGSSQRGPSFRIPHRVLKQKKCSVLLDRCHKRIPSSVEDCSHEPATMQLFIPVPREKLRENSFRWHITTRNVFAFLLGRPLVGNHMGQAFVDVQERLIEYRPTHPNNYQDFLDYAENQGYRDLVECTDYALASLFYAEHFKLRDVWIDAFAHCVGMNESLAHSPEYALCSRLTKALITRAYLEVEMHLARVSSALGNFLKDDLSPAYLGLASGARNHLDRFRGFLQMYYTNKFGYWPPRKSTSFPKALYRSMFFDFKVLYDYLADTDSTTDIASQKPASGGLCVLQNVDNFDRRHNFKSQPYPLPLLPDYVPGSKKLDSQKALRQLTLATQHRKSQSLHSMSAALAAATNSPKEDMAKSKILRAYMEFERSHALSASQREEKISVVDGRKVRWLLIYCTLQYLASSLRAPKEVRDSESAGYPLCCMADQSIWSTNGHIATSTPIASGTPSQAASTGPCHSEKDSAYQIEPDCHREDYFAPKTSVRSKSCEMPAPLKFATPTRQSSLRAFKVRSLSVRSSRDSRRSSTTLKSVKSCANLADTNGDNLNTFCPQATSRDSNTTFMDDSKHDGPGNMPPSDSSWLRSRTPSVPRSASHSRRPSIDVISPNTHSLGSFQIGNTSNLTPTKQPRDTPARSDSTGSNTSSTWSQSGSIASSKTSTDSERYDTCSPNQSVESSGLLGGLVPIGSNVTGMTQTSSHAQDIASQSHIHPLLRKPSPSNDFDFDFTIQEPSQSAEQHAGIEFDGRGGIRFPASPSPPIPDHPVTITRADAAALAAKKRVQQFQQAISADSGSGSSKKGRNSFAFPDLPSNELWEQYRNNLANRENQDRSSYGDATPPPISKSIHNFKRPSMHPGGTASVDVKGGRRKSTRKIPSFWKR